MKVPLDVLTRRASELRRSPERDTTQLILIAKIEAAIDAERLTLFNIEPIPDEDLAAVLSQEPLVA